MDRREVVVLLASLEDRRRLVIKGLLSIILREEKGIRELHIILQGVGVLLRCSSGFGGSRGGFGKGGFSRRGFDWGELFGFLIVQDQFGDRGWRWRFLRITNSMRNSKVF